MFSRPEKDFEYSVEKEAVSEHLKKVVSIGGFGFLSEVAEKTFEYLVEKEANEENSVYLSHQDLISYLENEYIFENPEEIKTAKVEKQVMEEVEDLTDCIDKHECNFIVVSNEVGLGLVPDNKLGRVYRDLLGKANQLLARHASEVYFMVSGIPVKIKG